MRTRWKKIFASILNSLANSLTLRYVFNWVKDNGQFLEPIVQLFQVMRDADNGVSRGFGFVTFACSFMAEAAFEHDEHLINEKVLRDFHLLAVSVVYHNS